MLELDYSYNFNIELFKTSECSDRNLAYYMPWWPCHRQVFESRTLPSMFDQLIKYLNSSIYSFVFTEALYKAFQYAVLSLTSQLVYLSMCSKSSGLFLRRSIFGFTMIEKYVWIQETWTDYVKIIFTPFQNYLDSYFLTWSILTTMNVCSTFMLCALSIC